MERFLISKYNEKLKKIKIDEIETQKNDDLLTNEIYQIAINELPDGVENFSEEEIDEKIIFNKVPFESLLSSSINSNSLSSSITNSLCQSSASVHSDKTDASSNFHYKFNDNLNILESCDNNNDNFKRKIDITNIITGEEKRTMIEINKIPKKYSIKALKDELNNKGFKGKYDYINFEGIDRYNNDININTNYRKAFINFIDPLHIVIFYFLYQKKYFNFKGNLIDIQYSNHFPKKNICLESNNLKNSYNSNLRKSINETSKIEIPKEYFDFYKKVNPNDVCINMNDSNFGIDTFFVKKNNNIKK